MPDDVAARARRFAALGDPARLAIVEHLLLGDSSPGELRAVTGAATNLMAHHLGVLEGSGLVRRFRSEGDGRRTYVQLRREDAEVRLLAELLLGQAPPPVRIPERIVFVCTANAARSQLAAALWARQSRLPVSSAGTRPAAQVHPRAVQAARRHGLAMGEREPRDVREAKIGDTDLVVAVCDNAHEELVAATAPARRRDWLHWSVADPVRPGTRAAFEAAYLQLESRVRDLAGKLAESRGA